MGRIYSIYACIIFITGTGFGQDHIITLWPGIIPNNIATDEQESHQRGDILWIEKVSEPTLEILLPAKSHATGRAVVICPGGGYRGLAYDWEGTDIAKLLNSRGIAAFVLKYRLPGSKSVMIPHKAPLQDAQRAIRLVRNGATKYNISVDQVGVMGFSAGGHLASTLSTHYEDKTYTVQNSFDTLSARPDFQILIYPVITMKDPHTHQGSRHNLLGDNPKQELIDEYSNELQVDKNTPPAFLIHSSDDTAVSVENSLKFYRALLKDDIEAEMHIYPKGGHGFALAIGKGHLQSWTDSLFEWLDSLN